MKKILFPILFLAVAFVGCDKDEAATAGIIMDNVLPPYVELTSTSAKTVKEGASTTVAFRLRTAIQENVVVTYNITGALNMPNQTITIPRDALTASATINVPAGTIVAPATTATATLTFVKAVTASGRELGVGQKGPANQKVTINITQ